MRWEGVRGVPCYRQEQVESPRAGPGREGLVPGLILRLGPGRCQAGLSFPVIPRAQAGGASPARFLPANAQTQVTHTLLGKNRL